MKTCAEQCEQYSYIVRIFQQGQGWAAFSLRWLHGQFAKHSVGMLGAGVDAFPKRERGDLLKACIKDYAAIRWRST